jgi:hypothetical protein
LNIYIASLQIKIIHNKTCAYFCVSIRFLKVYYYDSQKDGYTKPIFFYWSKKGKTLDDTRNWTTAAPKDTRHWTTSGIPETRQHRLRDIQEKKLDNSGTTDITRKKTTPAPRETINWAREPTKKKTSAVRDTRNWTTSGIGKYLQRWDNSSS